MPTPEVEQQAKVDRTNNKNATDVNVNIYISSSKDEPPQSQLRGSSNVTQLHNQGVPSSERVKSSQANVESPDHSKKSPIPNMRNSESPEPKSIPSDVKRHRSKSPVRKRSPNYRRKSPDMRRPNSRRHEDR